jgi:hypothetical protein
MREVFAAGDRESITKSAGIAKHCRRPGLNPGDFGNLGNFGNCTLVHRVCAVNNFRRSN